MIRLIETCDLYKLTYTEPVNPNELNRNIVLVRNHWRLLISKNRFGI